MSWLCWLALVVIVALVAAWLILRDLIRSSDEPGSDDWPF